MKVNWDDYSPYMWKTQSHVPVTTIQLKMIKVIPLPHGGGPWWTQLLHGIRDSCSSRPQLSPLLPEDAEGAGWWLAPEATAWCHVVSGYPPCDEIEASDVEINMDRIAKR